MSPDATLSNSKWSRPNVHSFEDVLEHDETFFGDEITRRSPKLAQRAFSPALASRGAKCDLASKTDN